MKTILKWPGGKEKELPIIRKYMPNYSGRFVEPFVGGGAVFFDTEAAQCCINDKSYELINLYNCIRNKDNDFIYFIQQENNEFTSLGTLVDENKDTILELYHSRLAINDFIEQYKDFLYKLAGNYNTVFIDELNRNLKSKITRAQKPEREHGEISNADRLDNMEAALKSSYYMYIRYLQNHLQELTKGHQAAVFFFVREYCYSSMFRYNSNGKFNVPYGGISYNRKDFQKKIDYLLSDELYEKLQKTNICCDDFEPFMDSLNLTSDDFVFLGPPYDTDFSTYAGNEFGKDEQIRLCECLKRTPAKLLLIIKNTDFIYNLYKDSFNITSFDKKYMVSFMNRNDRNSEHLIITNY